MITFFGVFIVAAVATAADYVWYSYGVRHSMTSGMIHGAVLLTTVGAVLGAASGRLLKGLPIGFLAGLGGAASYYLLVETMDRRTYGSAIPAAWMITWLVLAALDGRWLRAPGRRGWPAVAVRGLAAAVIGGLAFFLVMDILWGRPPAGGRNYLVQFFAWAFAWAPGLVALTSGPERVPVRTVVETRATPVALGASLPPPDVERSVTPVEVLTRIDQGETLHILDVRSEGEFAAGHVPGAVNVPFTQVLSRIGEVPGAPEDELILYCGHGPRAYMAATALRHGGRSRIVYMSGHWAGWQGKGLREERDPVQ